MIDTIRLGEIIAIDNTLPILRVSVKIPGSGEIETAALWNNWAENSYPLVGSLCIVFMLNCNFAQKYAFAFNLSDAISVLSGEKVIYIPSGVKIYLKQNGSLNIEAPTSIDVTTPDINQTGNINADGNCDVGGVYKVGGTQVVTNQQPAIPNPLLGLPEVHAAVDSILIAMRTHGLIAT